MYYYNNKCRWIHMPEHLARNAANLLLAGGYTFTSENEQLEKAFRVFEDKNDLFNLMYAIEKKLSVHGRHILILDKFDGTVSVTPVNLGMFNKVGKILFKDKVAVISRSINIDDRTHNYKETITDEYRKIEMDNPEEISIDGVNAKLDPEERLQAEVKHGLGVMPLQEFFNLPFKPTAYDYQSTSFWRELTDGYPAGHLPALVDKILDQVEKEVILNKTRVFGDFTTAEMERLREAYRNELSTFIGDFFVKTQAGENQGKVEILQGDPKLAQYIQEGVVAIMNEYAHLSGYSGRNDKREQQTQEETNLTQKQEVATTAVKRDLRNKAWKKLIQKVFIILGLCTDMDDKTDEWTFEIKDAAIKPRIQQLEESNLAIMSGLSTRERELQTLYDINESEAIKLGEEIDKEREQQMEMEGDQDENQSGENQESDESDGGQGSGNGGQATPND